MLKKNRCENSLDKIEFSKTYPKWDKNCNYKLRSLSIAFPCQIIRE